MPKSGKLTENVNKFNTVALGTSHEGAGRARGWRVAPHLKTFPQAFVIIYCQDITMIDEFD